MTGLKWQKWQKLTQNDQKCHKMTQNSQKWPKIAKNSPTYRNYDQWSTARPYPCKLFPNWVEEGQGGRRDIGGDPAEVGWRRILPGDFRIRWLPVLPVNPGDPNRRLGDPIRRIWLCLLNRMAFLVLCLKKWGKKWLIFEYKFSRNGTLWKFQDFSII